MRAPRQARIAEARRKGADGPGPSARQKAVASGVAPGRPAAKRERRDRRRPPPGRQRSAGNKWFTNRLVLWAVTTEQTCPTPLPSVRPAAYGRPDLPAVPTLTTGCAVSGGNCPQMGQFSNDLAGRHALSRPIAGWHAACKRNLLSFGSRIPAAMENGGPGSYPAERA